MCTTKSQDWIDTGRRSSTARIDHICRTALASGTGFLQQTGGCMVHVGSPMGDKHNSLEIERKFRVASDAWKRSVTGRVRLVDGLIAETDGRKARVRTCDGRATLTIKGARHGLAREEFEYEIPYEHAVRLLESHCGDRRIEKDRFMVPDSGLVWEIDVYDGIMNGIVVAEVELPSPDFVLTLPEWIGEEVTGKDEYRKLNMLKARIAQRTAHGC